VSSIPVTSFERLLARTPVARIGFFVLAACVVVFLVALDRSNLLDEYTYISNFITGPTLEWTRDFELDPEARWAWLVALFTEEILWSLWTTVVGSILDPEVAVRCTSVLASVLVVLGVVRLRHSVLALVLWALLPVGLAAVGIVQIRQGFALGLLLCIALRWNKPMLGLSVAAAVHTTFAVPLGCVMAVRFLPLSRMGRAAAAGGIAAFGATVAGLLFDLFGGRRLSAYTGDEGATSIYFVVAAVVLMIPSVWWLFLESKEAERLPNGKGIDACAAAHIASSIFVIVSFFVFPFGTARIAYYIQLLAIPALCSIRLTGPSFLLAVAPTCLALAYFIAKAFLDGTFSSILSM
jgi:hypothetical protein